MSWCKYLENPSTYKHSHLPYGKGLTGEGLRKDLEEALAPFIQNAEKLARMDSTQGNENFNHCAINKAPKNKHYSETESLSFRLAAVVSQKNEGYMYLALVSPSPNSQGSYAR